MIRIAKRGYVSNYQAIGIRLLAIGLALLTGGLFIFSMGHSPLAVYQAMLVGAFGSKLRFQDTLVIAIPLIITSLGILLAFKLKFWNIGAEGQILMGAFMASYIALHFSDWPKPVVLLLMMVAGFIGGSLWILLPAYLKIRLDTNETIVTLMMNYIAVKWVMYLQYGPWKDPKSMGFPKIANFSETATLPKVFGVHVGWLIGILLIILITIIFRFSKIGFKINVIGESKETARYAGIKLNKVMLFSILASGGVCGLVGMIEASAVNHTLSASLSSGYGYTAIITTWLSALNPLAIPVVSILFAAMIKGGDFIQTAFQIPASAAGVLQSVILFFVIGSEFFIQYRLVHRKKEKEVKFNQSTGQKGESQ